MASNPQSHSRTHCTWVKSSTVLCVLGGLPVHFPGLKDDSERGQVSVTSGPRPLASGRSPDPITSLTGLQLRRTEGNPQLSRDAETAHSPTAQSPNAPLQEGEATGEILAPEPRGPPAHLTPPRNAWDSKTQSLRSTGAMQADGSTLSPSGRQR